MATAAKKAKKTRQEYSDEFKARAVKAAKGSGTTVVGVAKELKIGAPMLARWMKEAGEGKRPRKNGKSHGPSALKVLEAEQVRLEMALASIRQTIRLLKNV